MAADLQPRKPASGGKTADCLHCGTRFKPTDREGEFCCSGCRFVYHLLHKRGLEDFYKFDNGRAPVAPGIFEERSWEWLREAQKSAEPAGGECAELTLRIQGISCAGCVWLLEAVFDEQPGRISARVDASAGQIRLRWKSGECDLPAFAADVARFGYSLGPDDGATREAPLRPLVLRMGLCAALALNAMLFSLPRYLGLDPGDRLSALFDVIGLGLATASVVIGGPVFFRRAWGALRRGDLHIDLPISLGLILAYAGSVLAWRVGDHAFAYFDFVSIFTFLMLVGRWLQERAVENNRRRLLGLRLTPGRVKILRDGIETDSASEALDAGDRFRVPRGGLVPVRAALAGSPGIFALNWITGEPAPREFPAGAPVPSGARNISPGELDFLALEGWESSGLARLLSFDARQPWRNEGLQRFIRIYLACVLVLAALGFAGWLVAGGGVVAAFQVMISVLVVSCPCAAGVALPLLDDVAAARLQPFGIYLREHTLWQRLLRVKNVLFDKTGTVTLEHLALADPGALDHLAEEPRRVLLGLCGISLHPVAACLREALLSAGIEPCPVPGAREVVGMGLEWESPRGLWRFGRASWAGGSDGKTTFSLDGVPLAELAFNEELRPDAAGQIANLSRRGLGIRLLSGDEPARVARTAEALGLAPEHALGGLTPDDKARLVSERWSRDALMLGDGANDSLAFDAALCRGTPAIETGLLENKADFFILGRSLRGLDELFAAAARHRMATLAVLAFAIAYNTCAILVALAGWMSPLVAAIIMPLSSLISIGLVFLNLRAPRQIQNTQP